MNTQPYIYRVDRRRIGFLKFIIEAYEGIATVTTIDPGQGIVAIRVAPGCADEITELIAHLKQEIRIETMQHQKDT